MSWFKQQAPAAPIVVELESKDSKPAANPGEIRAALEALEHNAGFQELMRRHRIAKALLRAQLETSDDNSVETRALIKAFSWLERTYRTEIAKQPERTPRSLFAEEQDEFERIAQAIQFVGRPQPN